MKTLNRVGERWLTNEGYTAEIIEYFGWDNCTIRLSDKRGTILYKIYYSNLKKGTVSNPYHPSVCDIGYRGEGEFKSEIKDVSTKEYTCWGGIIRRCYSEKCQINNPAYIKIIVDERWHNFQIFAQWYEDNFKSYMDSNWDVDKDILFKGNKIYSPETCCFVPSEINSLFTKNDKKRGKCPIGVSKKDNKYSSTINKNDYSVFLGYYDTPEEAFQAYKIEKEEWIKEVADKWRPMISELLWRAMYNWKVEITD